MSSENVTPVNISLFGLMTVIIIINLKNVYIFNIYIYIFQ